jgi:hypothetical protein
MISLDQIRSLLPSANIKSIVLDDPKQITQPPGNDPPFEEGHTKGQLNVRVKATVITPSDMFTSANIPQIFMSMPGFDFGRHIKVALIQSRDNILSKVLQSMGDEILKYIGPLDSWHGNEIFNDRLKTAIASQYPGFGDSGDDLALFKAGAMSIQTQEVFPPASNNKPILEKTDQSGKRVKSLPMDFNFTINNKNPKHLAYFMVSYLDVTSLVESVMQSETKQIEDFGQPVDLGLTALDFASISGFNTPVNFDIVFNDSRVSGATFFFKTSGAQLWTGPVHRMADGRYMTGNTHGAGPNNYLTVVKTYNVKIQDFRNRKGLMAVRVMDDFQDEKKTIQNIIKGFRPRIRELTPGFNSTHPYVSQLFVSTGGRATSKLCFL